MDEIEKNTQIDITDEAVGAELDEMMYNYNNRLKYQGIDLQKYEEMMGKTLEQFEVSTKTIKKEKIE